MPNRGSHQAAWPALGAIAFRLLTAVEAEGPPNDDAEDLYVPRDARGRVLLEPFCGEGRRRSWRPCRRRSTSPRPLERERERSPSFRSPQDVVVMANELVKERIF